MALLSAVDIYGDTDICNVYLSNGPESEATLSCSRHISIQQETDRRAQNASAKQQSHAEQCRDTLVTSLTSAGGTTAAIGALYKR